MKKVNVGPRDGVTIAILFASLIVLTLVFNLLAYRGQAENIPYSQFLTMLTEKKFNSVIVAEDRIEGTLREAPQGRPNRYVAVRMEDPALEEKLEKSGVSFEALKTNRRWLDVLYGFGFPLLMLVGWWFIAVRGRGQSHFLSLEKSKAKVYVERDLKIKFSDVAGVDEAKAELQEIVDFLKDPSKYSRLGGRLPKGVLLVGPPGTGKTLLARAVAGEAQVPFFSINGSEFVEMFVGLGAARVRDLFAKAREQIPCIIFIDELDALGKARGLAAMASGANDEKEQTLNQLLAELDGFDPSRGVILLSATNRPEILDPALLRSGRFDKQIMVDMPDRKGREAILKIHCRSIRVVQRVSLEKIASLTTGFSGADLANLVNEAALIATRRSADQVEETDFTAGIERIVGGLERKSRVLNLAEKNRVAFHEVGHVVVSLVLEPAEEIIHKVSVLPRGRGALGYTMRRPLEDRYLLDSKELERKVAVFLGGRASESVFFDEVSTGAVDDLEHATDLARAMVVRFGMSETLGPVMYEREGTPLLGNHDPGGGFNYSEATAQGIDKEIRDIVGRAFFRAVKIVRQYRRFVETTAQVLVEKETLDGPYLKNLWSQEQARVSSSNEPLRAGLFHAETDRLKKNIISKGDGA